MTFKVARVGLLFTSFESARRPFILGRVRDVVVTPQMKSYLRNSSMNAKAFASQLVSGYFTAVLEKAVQSQLDEIMDSSAYPNWIRVLLVSLLS